MATLAAMARRASGLSQAEVARRAGTSRPTLSAYEGGSRNPTLDTLECLLAANGQHLVSIPDAVFTRHSDRRGKPFFVPDQLPRLPVEAALATVVLPPHADWSPPGRPRNLADRSERLLAYQVVLADGMLTDILRFVNGTLLVDAWAELHLPGSITDFQVEVGRVFFAMPEAGSFLLAGGLALAAHGLTDRPTEDVDVFTSRAGEVPVAEGFA